MGLVYADVTLINPFDISLAKKNIIGEEEIKQMNVRTLVDTGAYMMTINETMQEYLQLPFRYKKRVLLADDSVHEYDIFGPILIKFQDMICSCETLVLPGNSEPLLGAEPLQSMNLIVDPTKHQLIENSKLHRI